MKRLPFAALHLIGFFVASLCAASAQTDAMPPETKAPAMQHKTMGPPSTSLTVVPESGAPLTLTLADLQVLPQETVNVHNAHSKMDETYSGPLLADVLAKAGVVLTEKTEHPLLHMYLVATGTDHYYVVYSMAEVEPGLNHTKVIVAIAKGGQPLNYGGQFQLVADQDAKPARWVHSVTKLALHTAQ